MPQGTLPHRPPQVVACGRSRRGHGNLQSIKIKRDSRQNILCGYLSLHIFSFILWEKNCSELFQQKINQSTLVYYPVEVGWCGGAAKHHGLVSVHSAPQPTSNGLLWFGACAGPGSKQGRAGKSPRDASPAGLSMTSKRTGGCRGRLRSLAATHFAGWCFP